MCLGEALSHKAEQRRLLPLREALLRLHRQAHRVPLTQRGRPRLSVKMPAGPLQAPDGGPQPRQVGDRSH